MSDSSRVGRVDSERNRAKILEVAERLFAERGIDVTLNDIAHEAGLGVGTVYRKFADKAALIEVLTEHKLQHLLKLVAAGLERPSVGESFRALMLSAAEARATDRGLFQILFRSGDDASKVNERALLVIHAWDEIIVRARAEGVVRQGFSSVDVDFFLLMIGGVADASAHVDPDAWRRCAAVLLDGYAPQPGDDAIGELNLDDGARRAIFLG